MRAWHHYLRQYFWLYLSRCRIIRLTESGYTKEPRLVPIQAFAIYCWPVAKYDSDEVYDQAGIFWGHEEMHKKYWCCMS